jgi:hypothetical protein
VEPKVRDGTPRKPFGSMEWAMATWLRRIVSVFDGGGGALT